jgi:formamidopyrimidine-DNA glycosylase
MPELPEVQTVVNTLVPRVVTRRLGPILHLRRDIVNPRSIDLRAHLKGRRVTDITRRGKRIVFWLDDANRFFIHLGMTGRLTVDVADAPLLPHTHFVVELAGRPRTQLRFRDPRRFGGIWWLGADDPAGTMGPEPLLMRPEQLAARLARTSRAIKNVLLDQSVVAGLGNIYVDEALFAARIHPLLRADRLTPPQIAALSRSIKLTLRRALRHRGSTLRDYVDADGERGGFQKLHRVYDREGEPCSRCRSTIQRFVLGGRSTCFCPKCQRSTVAAKHP